MDQEERREILARAYAALEGADQDREAFAERAEANRNARLLAEAQQHAAQQREPIPPVRRPPNAPRDYVAEGAFIRAIADQQCAALRAEIAEGVGAIIAEERRSQAKALGELRAELTKELAAIRREITVTGDIKATLENHITRIDAMFTRMWATDALLDLKQRDMLGLPRH